MILKIKMDTACERLKPLQATQGSAGLDLRAKGHHILYPDDTKIIPTGLRIAIESGYEAQIRPRSGHAKKCILVVNSPGTIDSDYRGSIGVLLHNLGNQVFKIEDGDRIAQMVIAPVPVVDIIYVDELDETTRGKGGFGSTGVS